jgi:hypothetical protein
MKITNLVQDMTQMLSDVADDANKFEIHGNNLAGSRVRKVMQKIKSMAQEVRIEVLAIQKERKEK